MTSLWLLRKYKDPTEEQIRRNLSGNLCRCTGYQSIVESIQYAAKLMENEDDQKQKVKPSQV